MAAALRLFINDAFETESRGAARTTLIGGGYSRQAPAHH